FCIKFPIMDESWLSVGKKSIAFDSRMDDKELWLSLLIAASNDEPEQTAPDEDKKQPNTEDEQKTHATECPDESASDVGASKRKGKQRAATYMPRVLRKRLNREAAQVPLNSRGQPDAKELQEQTATKENEQKPYTEDECHDKPATECHDEPPTESHDEPTKDNGASKRKRTSKGATYLPMVLRKRLHRQVKGSLNSRDQLDTQEQQDQTAKKEQQEPYTEEECHDEPATECHDEPSRESHDEPATDDGASKRKRTSRGATYLPRVLRKRLHRQVKGSLNSRGQLDTQEQQDQTASKEQQEHTATREYKQQPDTDKEQQTPDTDKEQQTSDTDDEQRTPDTNNEQQTTDTNVGASENKRRGVRGATYMPRVLKKRLLGERVKVVFNSRGQAVGENGIELQSYIGVLTRQTIPLTFREWRKVPKELKEKIWEEIHISYDVDPRDRKLIISSAGAKWRQFKSYLAVEYIIPFKDQPEMLQRPPENYNYISKKDWDTFVAIRLSEKCMKISEANTERVSKRKSTSKRLRGGYADIEADLQQKKDGEFVNDAAKEAAHKMDEISKKRKEPTSKLNVPRSTSDDCIIKMLEEQRIVMENERMERLEERKFFAQQMTMLQEEIQSLKSGNYSIKPKHVSEKVSYSAQSSHKDEVPRNDGNDQIIMLGEANTLAGRLCDLAVGKAGHIVARGKIIASGQADLEVFGVKLGEDKYSVSIDEVLDGAAILPIEIRDQTLTVEDVFAQHVPWPKHLVFTEENKRKKTRASEGEPSSLKPAEDKSKPGPCTLTRSHAETQMDIKKCIPIMLDKQVFGHERIVYISKDRFSDMNTNRQTCITLYMSYLHSELRKNNGDQMYGFVDPSCFSFDVGEVNHRANLLSATLKEACEDQIFLAPYNEDSHWMLVAIDPYNNSAYFMDPMGGRPSKEVKDVIKLGWRMWNVENNRISKNFKFDTIKAPRQLGGIESGYYVMRFMKDITETHILSSSDKTFHKETYSQDEIDTVREEWESYLGSLL
ncbi:hypothetical protein UlMin_007020, partial [Ulmus minor]